MGKLRGQSFCKNGNLISSAKQASINMFALFPCLFFVASSLHILYLWHFSIFFLCEQRDESIENKSFCISMISVSSGFCVNPNFLPPSTAKIKTHRRRHLLIITCISSVVVHLVFWFNQNAKRIMALILQALPRLSVEQWFKFSVFEVENSNIALF